MTRHSEEVRLGERGRERERQKKCSFGNKDKRETYLHSLAHVIKMISFFKNLKEIHQSKKYTNINNKLKLTSMETLIKGFYCMIVQY